MLGVYSYCPSV
jgi:hypothetical protein